ncbi:N-6 DNA methylase [Bradyrhizobium sp. LA2.1]|uniref:HsdM family class I SAM-dependent methyltransferase n=1 Tax=Bradyrhizobium sp. LA2.1 TaxID=3156376 RepID=UPI0033924CB9
MKQMNHSSIRVRGKTLPLLRVESLAGGRLQARAWSETVPERRRQAAAWSFIARAIGAYVSAKGAVLGRQLSVSPLHIALSYELEPEACQLSDVIGGLAGNLSIGEASYQLSTTYTALLPQSLRGALGIYYTPPALTERLLDMAEEGGIDWKSATVLDPACGGGAFLLPVALRLQAALPDVAPQQMLQHMAKQLRGFEIDPFAAWMTQAWLEIAFADVVKAAGQPFPAVVTVCDSLQQTPADKGFDLVVGNPPYGRVTLTREQRDLYKRSLYGHANLYGVFTDLALRWTKVGGVIAYVTPTSFLSGEYFKSLREVLAKQAPPLAMDFISSRRGVFEDVLQEAALATYRRGVRKRTVAVHYLDIAAETEARITQVGSFKLPKNKLAPWIAPRAPEQQALTAQLVQMDSRLSDWGYTVATGPLVWNRFKDQLVSSPGRHRYPLIWAEAITPDGKFIFRAERRNHAPYFEAMPGDDWLQVDQPCVLLQRTTAKEQSRRLIAAEMPAQFIEKHGRVVVENHLNMVRSIEKRPKLPAALVAAVLNSDVVDRAFRCISGSVAVSAFELEALPLPSFAQMKRLAPMLAKNDGGLAFAAALTKIYMKATV